MSVTVRLLGTGDPFASGGRAQACILLESATGRVQEDCGATAPLFLARAGLDPDDLDAVAISHLHGDHFAGLPFLLYGAAIRGRVSPRARPLLIAGPPDTESRLDAALALFAYPPLAEL